jgi:hypothetical protein
VSNVLRVVLDTTVFVRCFLGPRSAAGRIILQHNDRYRLFLALPMAEELLDVLTRPKLRAKMRASLQDVLKALGVLSNADAVELSDIPPVSRDPNDDMFLATALAAQADYLVTEDNDLLVLGSYHGTQIVTVGQFLRVLEDLAAEGS